MEKDKSEMRLYVGTAAERSGSPTRLLLPVNMHSLSSKSVETTRTSQPVSDRICRCGRLKDTSPQEVAWSSGIKNLSGARSFDMVKSKRIIGEKQTTETRNYIPSLPATFTR